MSYSIAILYGLESIARSAEIFIYFVLVLFVFAMILVMPKVKVDNLLPVFENGILPIFKGSLLLSGYMNLPLISLMMIYPRVTNTVEAKKSLFSGYAIGTIVVFISNIMSILVLGSNITSKTQYPTYLLAKEINVGIIFSRIEVFIASIWIVGTFFKLLFYFYAGNVGLSQILGQKDYRYMILPMELIVSVLVTIVYKYAMDSANWAITSWTPFIWSTAFVLPVFLLAIAVIKKNLGMNKSS